MGRATTLLYTAGYSWRTRLAMPPLRPAGCACLPDSPVPGDSVALPPPEFWVPTCHGSPPGACWDWDRLSPAATACAAPATAPATACATTAPAPASYLRIPATTCTAITVCWEQDGTLGPAPQFAPSLPLDIWAGTCLYAAHCCYAPASCLLWTAILLYYILNNMIPASGIPAADIVIFWRTLYANIEFLHRECLESIEDSCTLHWFSA